MYRTDTSIASAEEIVGRNRAQRRYGKAQSRRPPKRTTLTGAHKARAAFTKTELLVACVCLVVLLGLLMPAINGGLRDGSRRAHCASRMGELVAGFMQYELAKKQYPGYLNAFAQDEEGSIKVGTWAVAILPYIESGTTYELWTDTGTTGQWNRRGGGGSEMNAQFYPSKSAFTCPSDANAGDGQGPCSFAVNAGFFPDILPPSYEGLNPHEIARRSSRPANGVFSNQLPAEVECTHTSNKRFKVLGSRADAPTRASDIHDGLTQTIAIAESINADAWSQAGRDSHWQSVEIEGVTYKGDDLHPQWSPRVRLGIVWQYKADPPVSGVAKYTPSKLPAINQNRTFQPEYARPSSFHSGLYHVGMLGGSVTAISQNIDYRVLQSLMTPHTEESDAPDPSYKLKESDYQ